MARVTVEDCVEIIPNRFELVVLSAQRSREVSAGAQLTRERDNDKNPVLALREIADKTVDPKELKESLINGLQKHFETDEPEEDDMAMLMSSDQWATGAEVPAGTTDIEIGRSSSEAIEPDNAAGASAGDQAPAGQETPSEPVPPSEPVQANDDSTESGGL